MLRSFDRNFRMFAKNQNFLQKSKIFQEKTISPFWSFFSKISIFQRYFDFVKKYDFTAKLQFFSKISIFQHNFDFVPKLKIEILVENRNFGQISKFCSKIELLIENRNLMKIPVFGTNSNVGQNINLS